MDPDPDPRGTNPPLLHPLLRSPSSPPSGKVSSKLHFHVSLILPFRPFQFSINITRSFLLSLCFCVRQLTLLSLIHDALPHCFNYDCFGTLFFFFCIFRFWVGEGEICIGWARASNCGESGEQSEKSTEACREH